MKTLDCDDLIFFKIYAEDLANILTKARLIGNITPRSCDITIDVDNPLCASSFKMLGEDLFITCIRPKEGYHMFIWPNEESMSREGPFTGFSSHEFFHHPIESE